MFIPLLLQAIFVVSSFSLLAEENPYLPMNDPRLCTRSRYIDHSEFGTKELKKIEDILQSIAKTEPRMAGLAAPQIGVFQRVIIVDMNIAKRRENADIIPEFRTFVNPQIIWKSKETEKEREACFSTGPFMGIVSRPQRIKMCAYTVDGELEVLELEGYLARVFQHEVDHLDGLRFPDRLEKNEKLHIVTKEMVPAYREQWMDWNITCGLEEWEGVKQGKEFTIPLFDGPSTIAEN